MIYETIEPCRRKKGFEGIPSEFYQVPLEILKNELIKTLDSYKLLRETKVMLVLQNEKNGYKISIFPSCRIFIHGDVDEKEAKEILNEISNSIKHILSS